MAFTYCDERLFVEQIPLADVAARFGTPCYVYSRAVLERNWRSYHQAFGARRHRVCYAVKANGNIGLLNVLARLGSGFDIVSRGELARCLAAGADPAHIVFSGVGKGRAEIRYALEAGIGCLNVESGAELARIERVAAEIGRIAPISLRVNPDVDPQTHPYISTGLHESKFGIPMEAAARLYEAAARSPHLAVRGIACHIGSQLTALAPFIDAIARVMALVRALAAQGIALDRIDVGGGLGISYRDETPPPIADYVRTVSDAVGTGFELVTEPGRSLVGNAGVLLTTVEYLKETPAKNFAIVDAAMTELIRPALYQAWHAVCPLVRDRSGTIRRYELVGPVCETGDFLANDRELSLAEGAQLAIMDAGAYGFAMASNYNARLRPPEVLVDGKEMHLVRARETLEDLWSAECLLPS